MHLARRWLYRDTEMDRKQLPWIETVVHEKYSYDIARMAVKFALVLGRIGPVVSQMLTSFWLDRQKSIEAVTTQADRGSTTKPLAIVRVETQFLFAHFTVEVPFGMTSREAKFKAKLERVKAAMYSLFC